MGVCVDSTTDLLGIYPETAHMMSCFTERFAQLTGSVARHHDILPGRKLLLCGQYGWLWFIGVLGWM